MGREYEREKYASRSRSKSRGRSESEELRRKYSNGSRENSERRKSPKKSSRYEKYRSSRSPRSNIRYKRKTSRDNSSENPGTTVYISNLSKSIRDEEIKEAFSKFGKLDNINIIRDPFTKECRGFGFLNYEVSKDAHDAIRDMNKKEFYGKTVTVEMSKRSKGHKPTPGVYLGPSTGTQRPRRSYSPRNRRRYNSRSRSRDRERNHYRRKSPSRSRSRDRYRSRSKSSYSRRK